MTAILIADNLQETASSTAYPVSYFKGRIVQRVNRWFKGGLWNPGNNYREIPGGMLNITPMYDDSILVYTYMCPLGHRGAAHSITHWRFYVNGVEFARHNRSIDHQESSQSMRWEIPSWGRGVTGTMGYYVRQYSDSNHSVHYNGRRYYEGADSSRGVTAHTTIEEYVPAS